MYLDARTTAVGRLLREFTASLSLRHMRDDSTIGRMAHRVVEALDQVSSVWKKWDGAREAVLAEALECWIPREDLLEFLNSLPGALLTATDLEQRMRAMVEKEYVADWPHPGLRLESEKIYLEERKSGTEMMAIIGRMSQYVSSQFGRLQEEARAAEAERLDRARLEREAKLLSSMDCSWTALRGSKSMFCRKNGRVFRLTSASDGKLEMFRVDEVSDEEAGRMIGRYKTRGDASKVVAKAAYEDEGRWGR